MAAKQPDITREKILDAAFQEVYRHGFQAASLNNILAKIGLTKGALYHHFPTKGDLGHAVIDEVIRDGLDAMVFAPLRESDDPAATLLDIIRAKGERTTLESVSLGCPLNNLMQEMSPLDTQFKKRLTSPIGRVAEGGRGCLAARPAAGAGAEGCGLPCRRIVSGIGLGRLHGRGQKSAIGKRIPALHEATRSVRLEFDGFAQTALKNFPWNGSV